MYFSTAVIAAFAATYVSASPLMVRGNTCSAAPGGSNSNNQPISQPSGIQTSAACQKECESNSSCKSFCFGMVDNTIQCKLYSYAASAVPQQSSANLVVYDKACYTVPNVVPTSSNPTGKKVDNQQAQSSSNSGSKTSEQQAQDSKKADASKTSGQKATESKQADSSKTSGQKATESEQAQASNDNSYGTQKQSSSNTNNQKQSSSNSNKQSSSANTCGTKPVASTNNQPISTSSVSSEDACKTKCQANSSCKSFTCGKVDNAMVCKLYSVAAAQVPSPSTTAQKNALKAYDVGCSI